MHAIQQKILDLAATHNLGAMSLREIGRLINEEAAQTIKHHLIQLERRGLLTIDRDRNLIERVKKRIEQQSKFVNIPVLGAADCGPARHFAEEQPEGFIKVSKKIFPSAKNIFAVQAHGSSMNQAKIKGLKKSAKNIEDGDYVLIDSKYVQPKNGDYVLSIIDGCANIKKYFQDKDNEQIILMSESTKNYPPIYVHWNEAGDCIVGGKVIEVIKKPKTF